MVIVTLRSDFNQERDIPTYNTGHHTVSTFFQTKHGVFCPRYGHNRDLTYSERPPKLCVLLTTTQMYLRDALDAALVTKFHDLTVQVVLDVHLSMSIY